MALFIVVGGGLLGILTARELAIAGNQVKLLEMGTMASESTWAGGGILSPLYPWRYPDSITRLAAWSQEQYPEFCGQLKNTTKTDPEYRRSGMVTIAPGEEAAAEKWATNHKTALERISHDELKTLEPALAAFTSDALWMPDVAQVRNPRLAQALTEDILAQGVTLHTHQPVTELRMRGDRVSGVVTTHGLLEADAVVVCAGAWSAKLIEKFTSPPDIHPVRGQMLLFHTKPDLIKRIVLEENRYIIPRQDGRVLFGSTVEEVGFDKQTTEAARDELHAVATQRFPSLKDYPVERHWAGLRPAAPNGIPYICEHHELSGLFINAGHFRNGVVLGLASARLCADLILHRNPILPPDPYSLSADRKH